MRYLLNQIYGDCGATVADFASDVQTAGLVPTDITPAGRQIILRPLESFTMMPQVLSEELFGFIASAPRLLAEQAGELVSRSDDEDEYVQAKLQVLSDHCIRMGALLDEYTKYLTKLAPWKQISRNTVDVTRIWRTKKDEILGSPEDRKVMCENLPNRMASLVMAIDEGRPDKVMLAVSNGQYRGDGADCAREDFLIDLPLMIHTGMTAGANGFKSASVAAETCLVLNRMVEGALPLIRQIVEVARQLDDLDALDDPKHIYKGVEFLKRRTLNPEDSPNALIDIGTWA